MEDYRLSRHFWLSEFTVSETATRLGIDNSPSATVLLNLAATAMDMEVVRTALDNHGIVPTSVFRCLELNRVLKSKDTSAHVQGYAVDFACPSFGTPRQIWEHLTQFPVGHDQLILEFDRWVHISFDPRLRNQTFATG